jgi:hypothetical protein
MGRVYALRPTDDLENLKSRLLVDVRNETDEAVDGVQTGWGRHFC